jgi:hypothetical protein
MPAKPDPTPPSAERIERLQRSRTRLMYFQAILFLVWQSTYFATPHGADAVRDASHVKIAAYVVWALALLAFVATGGGYFQPRAVREVLNDEVTVANRKTAMATGYLVSMLLAVGCYLVSLFEPMSAHEVIHTVLTGGVATALLNFAVLERRAQG